MPPTGPQQGPQWSAQQAAVPGRTPQRLPAGYRWIAVRPGAAPPPRRGRRALGPTPRYSVIPRWGLTDHFDAAVEQQQAPPRSGPSGAMVRATLMTTIVVLGIAALAHVVRYGLLIINRTVLLNPWVAGAATWLPVAVSVIAMFTVLASAVVLTNWLVGRRAAAFAFRGHTDPRRVWAMRLGCLIPFVNLAWAPVYVIELAGVEERLTWLRRQIVAWWLVWIVSYAVSILSIATSFTRDAQGIADNTVTTAVAYLAAMAAVLLAMKVFEGFERRPVERPVKRWVIADDLKAGRRVEAEKAEAEKREPETVATVESEGQNPAA